MLEWIAMRWCKTTHTKALWPIHGRYRCAQCFRQHPVSWNGGGNDSWRSPAGRSAARGRLIPAVVPAGESDLTV